MDERLDLPPVAPPVTVHIGRIEEVHAEIERAMSRRERLLVIDGTPESTDRPGAESHFRDPPPRPTECPILHLAPPSTFPVDAHDRERMPPHGPWPCFPRGQSRVGIDRHGLSLTSVPRSAWYRWRPLHHRAVISREGRVGGGQPEVHDADAERVVLAKAILAGGDASRARSRSGRRGLPEGTGKGAKRCPYKRPSVHQTCLLRASQRAIGSAPCDCPAGRSALAPSSRVVRTYPLESRMANSSAVSSWCPRSGRNPSAEWRRRR